MKGLPDRAVLTHLNDFAELHHRGKLLVPLLLLLSNSIACCLSFGYPECVRMKGLEPPRLSAQDPKSCAATNYATSAYPDNIPAKPAQSYYFFAEPKAFKKALFSVCIFLPENSRM